MKRNKMKKIKILLGSSLDLKKKPKTTTNNCGCFGLIFLVLIFVSYILTQ